jgi:Zn-dependent protease with chaperone function
MSELVFPLVGTAIVILIVLPACALLAKLALVLLDRHEAVGPLHGLSLRFLLLTASSALPLAWFFSAGLHQAESGESMLACLFSHDTTTLCLESGFFALALGVVVVARSMKVVRCAWTHTARHETQIQRARLQRIFSLHPMLQPLHDRVVLSDVEGFSLATQGWLRPRIIIGIGFASRLSDDMLASALGHEMAHVRSLDPLRYTVLELALAVNPLGRFLLEPHVWRWYAAREVHCDREAVMQGCRPLPLADAIVRAARPGPLEAVPLGASDLGMLELRIGLLLAMAEHRPIHSWQPGMSALPTAITLWVMALLLPHQMGTGALDALHQGAERVLTYFL